MPQVALLFLVLDQIPTEPVWTAFIASAAELSLRARVPPTQPSLPRLLPPLEANVSNLNASCWSHGQTLTLHMHPRASHSGSHPTAGASLYPSPMDSHILAPALLVENICLPMPIVNRRRAPVCGDHSSCVCQAQASPMPGAKQNAGHCHSGRGVADCL